MEGQGWSRTQLPLDPTGVFVDGINEYMSSAQHCAGHMTPPLRGQNSGTWGSRRESGVQRLLSEKDLGELAIPSIP